MALTHPAWTVDTTFSSKNIATAASVYTFTAAAAAKVKITVKLTNAAGNGDYIVYLTHQWLGTGTAAVVLPKTTCAAASGETVVQFMSMELDVRATDVIDVYIDGLAGDTAVNGAIRISADNPSVFDAANDTPAVNVTYQAGVAVAPADANGNVPVVLYGTQPAVEFGQVKITTNVASQGALHIRNNNALGRGIDVYSYLAAKLEGSDRGVQLQGGSNQALFLLSNTAAATVYIEGPTTGGKAIAISSPSDGSSGANASGIYIETEGGHPGIVFVFSDPADAVRVINSNQGNWKLDELLADLIEDTGTTLPGLISAGGSGTGLYSETITVKDGDDLPVDGVLVQVATDSAFSNVVRSGYTDNLGQVTLNFDAVGTYYGRAEISDFDVATFTVTIS